MFMIFVFELGGGWSH